MGGGALNRLPESMPLMFVYMTNGLESRRPRASMEYEMDDARSVRSLLHALLSLEAPSRLSNVPKRLTPQPQPSTIDRPSLSPTSSHSRCVSLRLILLRVGVPESFLRYCTFGIGCVSSFSHPSPLTKQCARGSLPSLLATGLEGLEGLEMEMTKSANRTALVSVWMDEATRYAGNTQPTHGEYIGKIQGAYCSYYCLYHQRANLQHSLALQPARYCQGKCAPERRNRRLASGVGGLRLESCRT